MINSVILENNANSSKNSELLESDYNELSEYCKRLEYELADSKSQIKSMKLALTYSDSYSVRKETEMRQEIERLKQALVEKLEKKKKKPLWPVKSTKNQDISMT